VLPLGRADEAFPNTHIFSDAFRFLPDPAAGSGAESGPISQSITVTGVTTPTPPTLPVPAGRAAAAGDELTVTAEVPAPDPNTFPVLQQLGQVHGQMIDQLHQSLTLMTERVVQVPGPHLRELQGELTRLAELNAEFGRLQADALRADPPAADELPPDAPRPPAADAIRDWVFARLDALAQERQARWKRVFALIAGKTG
jgi:hypothetical protein